MTAVTTYRFGTVSAGAYQELLEQGLNLPDKPEGTLPSLPTSLTEMSDVELMECYSQFVAWSDYTTTQVAAAAVDERSAQAHLDALEAEVMIRDWTGKVTVTLQKAKTASDVAIVAARQSLDERYAYRKLVESLSQAMERNAQMLSRELTRRTSSDKTTSRGRHT